VHRCFSWKPICFGVLASAILCAATAAHAERVPQPPAPQQAIVEETAVQESENDPDLTAGNVIRPAAKTGFKLWLRNKVHGAQDDAKYGLQLDQGWEKADAERPLIVLVHGYNSEPNKIRELLAPIHEADFPCSAFAYPNDHHLEQSAERLSRELKSFVEAHPERRIALVTHSMGGLVARHCLENEHLAPGNVDRLIMIAPPSQGTLLAHFAVATDIWEHWLGRSDGGPWRRWRDSVVDGMGEAADDLLPGSPFLTQLNARQRNPDVHYAIFLGTGATVSTEEMDWLRKKLQQTADHIPGLSQPATKLKTLLAEMDELIDGKGDGVVAVKRGRLDGVEDVVVLPFGHLSVTGKTQDQAVREVQTALLARLQEQFD